MKKNLTGVLFSTLFLIAVLSNSLNAAESNKPFLKLVSTNLKGNPANKASKLMGLSSRGKVVTFQSAATNLGSSGSSPGKLFLKNVDTGDITSISLTIENLKKISDKYDENTKGEIKSSFTTENGRYIVMHLYTYNIEAAIGAPSHITFNKADYLSSILRINVENNEVKLIFKGTEVRNSNNADGPSSPIQFASSPNGRFIAYHTETSKEDLDYEIFVKDLKYGKKTLVTANVKGERASPNFQGYGHVVTSGWRHYSSEHSLVEVSNDGLVLFNSRAKNLSLNYKYSDLSELGLAVYNPVNAYLKNPFSGEVIHITDGEIEGLTIKGGAFKMLSGEAPHPYTFIGAVDMSPDGRFVLFNAAVDSSEKGGWLLRKDLQIGEVTLVAYSGEGESISDDGRYVIFKSSSSKLVDDDTNKMIDRFRKDMLTGEILRISVDSSGRQITKLSDPDGIKGLAKMSNNGKLIAFTSNGTGLVRKSYAGDNIYIADMSGYPLPSKAKELEALLPRFNDDVTPPTLKIVQKYKMRPVINKRMIFLLVNSKDTESGLSKILLSNDKKSWTVKPANTLINWRVKKGTGVRTVYVKAVDKKGNNTLSKICVKWDETKPLIKLSAPSNNSTIKGKIILKMSAEDPTVSGITSGIRHMWLYRNRTLLMKSDNNNFEYSLDTTKLTNGNHKFVFKATDKVGNVSIIDRTYNVKN